MVEAKDDINLINGQRQHNREQAKRLKAFRAQLPPGTHARLSEQGQMEIVAPAENADNHSNSMTDPAAGLAPAAPTQQTAASTVQPTPEPPADPAAAMRNLRFTVVGLLVVILFVLWVRQRRK